MVGPCRYVFAKHDSSKVVLGKNLEVNNVRLLSKLYGISPTYNKFVHKIMPYDCEQDKHTNIFLKAPPLFQEFARLSAKLMVTT